MFILSTTNRASPTHIKSSNKPCKQIIKWKNPFFWNWRSRCAIRTASSKCYQFDGRLMSYKCPATTISYIYAFKSHTRSSHQTHPYAHKTHTSRFTHMRYKYYTTSIRTNPTPTNRPQFVQTCIIVLGDDVCVALGKRLDVLKHVCVCHIVISQSVRSIAGDDERPWTLFWKWRSKLGAVSDSVQINLRRVRVWMWHK